MKTDTAPNKESLPDSILARAASYILAGIFVLLPFHALLTIYISTLVGNYDLLRLWKELLLLVLLGLAGAIVWKTPALRRKLRPALRSWLFWAITGYAALHVVLGMAALAKGQVNSYALLYAWIINLRPLLIFTVALVIAWRSDWLYRHWRQLLIWPAAAVIAFGLLQVFVLPANFLGNFGYSSATIEPYETIDEKEDYVRVQSTLRGSNPLGAYIVLILAAVLVTAGLRRQEIRNRWLDGALFGGGLVILFATYSRSAYLGMVLTVLAALILTVRSRQSRRKLWLVLAVLALLMAGAFAVLRQNDRFENTFFHTNEDSRSAISSNEQRATALQTAGSDLLREPFGRGPGTAGPASAHNAQPARVAENYYLQIGQETGWLGLGLFLTILGIIAKKLWKLRADPLARTLLVALVGISFINLVQHAWTDDTLALLWWGFAGVALAYRSTIGEAVRK